MTENITDSLQQSLPLSLYGRNGAKTWEELLHEVSTGESKIIQEGDRLIRLSRVVMVEVYSHNGQKLIEERQEFQNGDIRKRGIEGISEKLFAHELPEAGALRALREELGIELQLALTPLEEFKQERFSTSYPGLLTRYHCYRFRCQLPESCYQPEYIEVQERKRSFFRWI